MVWLSGVVVGVVEWLINAVLGWLMSEMSDKR